MVKIYASSMKQENISYWQTTLQNSQKHEFYRSFKTDHTSSGYLDLTRGTAGRRALVKLRISNQKLMIEIGRYNQTITKDNRHCPFCGCNVIEDEVHFLFQCRGPTYSMIRNKFYYKVKTLIPNITQLPINGLINELMNSSDYFINIYWSYGNRVGKHFVIFLNFPWLIASLLCCLLMSFFFF